MRLAPTLARRAVLVSAATVLAGVGLTGGVAAARDSHATADVTSSGSGSVSGSTGSGSAPGPTLPSPITPKVTVTATKAMTGQPVTFTATVGDKAGVTPTGSVTFTITGTDGSAPGCDGGSDTIGVNPTGTGTTVSAACSISGGLVAGASPYTVTAQYSGDSADDPSSGTLSKTIDPGTTTTNLVSSVTSTPVTGQEVAFTASVAALAPSVGTPTGSVTFTITGSDGSTPTCDGGTDVLPLGAGDSVTCSLPEGLLAAGSPFKVVAAYGGDGNFAASSVHLDQTVTQDAVPISLASAAGAGTGATNVAVNGESVTFTATVGTAEAPGAGAPTGSVRFSVVGNDGSTPKCDDGDLAPLSGGTAQCSFSGGLSAKAGNYTVTAMLVDPSFDTPTPAVLTETVEPGGTSLTLNGIDSVIATQAFTAKAVLATVGQGAGAGLPKGYVTFGMCNPSRCTGATVKLSGKTNANGDEVASFDFTSGFYPGSYTVTASYSGDSVYAPAVSNTVHVDITKSPTTTGLIASHNPAETGQAVTFRSAVLPDPNGTEGLGPPTGTVTFTVTGSTGDTVACQDGNTVTMDTNALDQALAECIVPSGTLSHSDSPYTVQAQYSGDGTYKASSTSITETVKD